MFSRSGAWRSCGLDKRGLLQIPRLARGCSGPACGGPLNLFVGQRASVTSTGVSRTEVRNGIGGADVRDTLA
jgi:hypothetical protein